MKLNLLTFGAHPDDVELSCSGTIAKCVSHGKKAGIIDLTRGELGTRGTPETRDAEAEAAGKILGISIRENLNFSDGFFKNDKAHQYEVIKLIRKYKPDIILCNAPEDRHPDHGMGAALVSDSCFLSGLIKIETSLDGKIQEAWRPRAVFNYIQDRYIKPSFLIDISGFIDKKMDSIRCFKSQFYDPGSTEPQTYISQKGFIDSVFSRSAEFGRILGTEHAEGFISSRLFGLGDIFNLI